MSVVLLSALEGCTPVYQVCRVLHYLFFFLPASFPACFSFSLFLFLCARHSAFEYNWPELYISSVHGQIYWIPAKRP